MRLFQNSGLMRTYAARLQRLVKGQTRFDELLHIFLDDRYGALHVLSPVLAGEPEAFFTNGDDEMLQRAWARENGLNSKAPLDEILLAQIESHCAEVFYNMDPFRFPGSFSRRLPSCVKKKIAWRAAPSGNADFGGYDLIVCNFPSILQGYRSKGWRAAYFFPAHDPEMDVYAAKRERPIDVLFVGGYSRHHINRVAVLDAVARLRSKAAIAYHLERSRFTTLAETPLGWIGPLSRHRRPADIRAVSRPAIFGRDLYEALSQAKIVLNGAIDMAGPDRGNMRCWEAMGCGALLLSDAGVYPQGMTDGKTTVIYRNPEDAVAAVERALAEREERLCLAAAGNEMIRTRYSKDRQWARFQELL